MISIFILLLEFLRMKLNTSIIGLLSCLFNTLVILSGVSFVTSKMYVLVTMLFVSLIFSFKLTTIVLLLKGLVQVFEEKYPKFE